jgi:hypothetical protein
LRQKHRAAPKSSCVLEPELAYVRASEPAKASPRAIVVKEPSGNSARRSEPASSVLQVVQVLELSTAESFVHELSTEKKAVLLPLWGARRHLGDLQKV